MSRSIFGWSLPPGVTNRMIEEAMGTEEPCACCGMDPADCICPVCPTCGDQGNPECYKPSTECPEVKPMIYNKAQRMGQSRLKIAQLKEQIADEEQYMAWLENQPDDWRDW